MNDSLPPLPPELRDALLASGGLPIEFEDPETHAVFVLQPVRESVVITLDEEYLRREIQKGLDELDAGKFVEWDKKSFLKRCHEKLREHERSQ